MAIKGSVMKSETLCEVCTQRIFIQTRNGELNRKAKNPLELVHSDLNGPRQNTKPRKAQIQSFMDDYSGTIFVYFLTNKSDLMEATERFIADTAPYGKIRCIRSDNEFILNLQAKIIKH